MRLARTFSLLTLEEFRLTLRLKIRYLFSTVTTLVANTIMLAGVLLVSMPSVNLDYGIGPVLQASNASRLLGFVYFFLGMSSVGLPEGVVSSSRQLGTIENSALSPLGLSGVICAKFLPGYCISLVEVCASTFFLSWAFGLPVEWKLGPLIANSLIAATGMLGLGLILGGLTIRVKQLGFFKNLLFVLLFALGIMPLGAQDAVSFSSLARFFPFTQGLMRTRDSLLPGLANAPGVSLPLFMGCSGVLLVAGVLVFRKFERDSLKQGTLGSY